MKIRLNIFYLLVLSILASKVVAQGEANIWYFGYNAGLDFNTSPPTPLTNGALSTNEGCASICDKNGNLLFYTDGSTVRNKNHLAMPNGTGLSGNSSSTQSAIIVPYPGTYNYGTRHFDKYFIVTVDYNGGSSGVRYSEVDMTLNSGLGGVTATKNIHLYGSSTSEKICVAQHANNCDFWVIGKPVGTPDYYSYAITSAGFNTTPVISSVGPSMGPHVGSLKASPDSKIVTTTHGSAPNGLYVYDFDNTSGVLTLKFSDGAPGGGAYSQEFSPDSKLLYYSLLNNSNIYQYDLTAPDNNAFLASRQIIGTTANNTSVRMGTLQLAPDGKIYACLTGQTSLGVINNPNTLGTACGYVDMQQSLGGRSAWLGLTALVTSLIRPVNKIVMSDSCSGSQTQFSLLDTNKIISYSWNFATLQAPNTSIGTSSLYNPVMQFDTAGDYIVTVITNYACFTDTIVDTLPIIQPSANFTAISACVGKQVIFTDNSSTPLGAISAWNWNFGDNSPDSSSQNTSHVYNAPGTYSATLIATTSSGCKDTLSKDVVVHPLPTVQFTANNVCDEKPVLITDQSSILSTDTLAAWQWNFGDGSPLHNQQQITGGHIYAASGMYNVQLVVTSTFGCMDSLTQPVIVQPKPEANFGSSEVCEGASTLFSDSSTTSSGTISTWEWEFGDGSPNTFTQNVSHLYANPGIDSATLIVQNNFGCADTITKQVTVYYNPVANFTFQNVCLGDSVLFYDSSTVHNSATINGFVWMFNDGSPTNSQQNPHHLYNNPGTYNVTLLVTTNQACSNAISKNVQMYDPPVTNFSVADICVVDTAVFLNSSVNPAMGTISSWIWNFGDGSAVDSVNQNPLHVYTNTGSYLVTLITRSSNLGCADTLNDSINVFGIPVAEFTAADVCLGQSISFTDASSPPTGNTIASWNWNFGDSSAIDTLQNPIQTYSNFGSYDVTLIVTSNQNCKDSVINTVIIHPLPEALFTTNNVCLGAITIFTGNSTVPANPTNDIIQQALWNMGDGTTIITQNPTHLYADTGSYAVQLIVTTNFGCADSLNVPVTVNPNPVAAFTISDTAGCTPLCISFTDTSTVSNGSNISWQWNLGDGSPVITSQDVSHCYTNAGSVPASFSPTLTVTSDSGCVSTLTKTNYVIVYPLPVADFTITPQTTTLATPAITVTNLSSGATTYNWDFGNSDTSSLFNPEPHNYSDAGTYLITLIITSTFGCMDTAYQTAIIEYSCELSVPNAFSPNNDGHNDAFILHGWDKCVSEFSIVIFNRWGEKVFESNSPSKSWDGKYKSGTNAIGSERQTSSDVFVYYINATLLSGETITKKGNITVIR